MKYFFWRCDAKKIGHDFLGTLYFIVFYVSLSQQENEQALYQMTVDTVISHYQKKNRD